MRLSRRHSRPTRLEALLREVDELRLTLDLDLTLAAAALDDDRADVVSDVIEQDRFVLADFAARADLHLQVAEAAEVIHAAEVVDSAELEAMPDASLLPDAQASARPPRRRRVLLTASQAVLAAAACAVAFAGVVPGANTKPAEPHASAQLEASYAEFAHLARSGGDPSRLVALGTRINHSIEPLIASAAVDPAKMRRMVRFLQEEQLLLLRIGTASSSRLLAQTRALVARLTAALGSALLLPSSQPDSSSADGNPAATPAPSPDTAASGSSGEAPGPSAEPTHQPWEQPQGTPSAQPSASPGQPQPTPTLDDPFPFGDMGLNDGRH